MNLSDSFEWWKGQQSHKEMKAMTRPEKCTYNNIFSFKALFDDIESKC